MTRQSEDLAAETAAMRAVDRALQAAAELPHRAHGRVLRYLEDLVGDRISAHVRAQGLAGNGGDTGFGWAHGGTSGGGGATHAVVGGGGAATVVGGGGGGPGGSGKTNSS